MTLTEIENFIGRYEKLKVRLEVLQEEIETVEETGLSALKFKFVKTKSNSIHRPVEEQAIENLSQTEDIRKEIYVLKKQISIIDKVLEGLDELERKIIYSKVIKNKSYGDICREISISEIYAKKLKRKGIIKIKQMINL